MHSQKMGLNGPASFLVRPPVLFSNSRFDVLSKSRGNVRAMAHIDLFPRLDQLGDVS